MPRERPESKVIRKNGAKIADRISAGGSELVQRFATSLAGEAFITSAGQFMVLGVPLFNQVTQMLGAVESRLKTIDTPGETLESFIEILQENPVLEDLADKLIAEYKSYGGTAFQSSSGTGASDSGSSKGAGDSSSTGADTLLVPVQESQAQPPTEASHTSTQHTSTPPSQEGVDNAPKLVYQMKANPRGIGVIINNKTFTSESTKDRTGTDIDAKALAELFTFLDFEVRRFDDLKNRDMCLKLQSVAAEDHSSFDCLMVAILSHGEEGKLYGTDNSEGDSSLVPIRDIISYFDGNHCPTLFGKPKIFILQACRGSRFDYGVEVESTDAPGAPQPSETDMKELMEEQFEHIIDRTLDDPDETDGGSYSGALPTEADFLLAYSTVPGYVSWRNTEFGSWFVKAFCDAVRELAAREHLMDILIEVNRKVAEEFESRKRNKQIPAPVTMLTRKLYFRPGEYS